MSMLQEFKKFAIKGNMIDMAVGIVIGAAFGKIIASLVSDIIMPPIGLLLGGVDFSHLSWVLQAKTADSAAVTLNYGQFLNTIISFIIIAFAVFIVIKQINRFQSKKEEAVTTKSCSECLSTIPLEAKRCAFCTSILET